MIRQQVSKRRPRSAHVSISGRIVSGAGSSETRNALCGGLFANQTEAVRFAMYEYQRRPQSVIMLPDGLKLDGEAPHFTPAQRFGS